MRNTCRSRCTTRGAGGCAVRREASGRGWLGGTLGIQRGPIDAFIPVIVFATVFGLSMDYEVFLVSRIREEWERHGDSSTAVRVGLGRTARVITAAGAVMTTVFASLVVADDRVLKLFGIAMAVAVFLDEILIRTVLLPAVLELLGRHTWALARRFDRYLPKSQSRGPSQDSTRLRDVAIMHDRARRRHGVFGDDAFGVLAEKMAPFLRTPEYIIGQTIVVASWIVFNVLTFTKTAHFDAPTAHALQPDLLDAGVVCSAPDPACPNTAGGRAPHTRLAQGLKTTTDKLFELLESSITLTQQDKDLTEQTAELTKQIHELLTQRA